MDPVDPIRLITTLLYHAKLCGNNAPGGLERSERSDCSERSEHRNTIHIVFC